MKLNPEKQGVRHPSNIEKLEQGINVHKANGTNNQNQIHPGLYNIGGLTVQSYSQRIEALKSRIPNHYHIDKSELIKNSAGVPSWIPADLLLDLSREYSPRVILINAGLGTGKTEATKAFFDHYKKRGLSVSHRKALITQLSERLNLPHYETIKRYPNDHALVEAAACTLHSLYALSTIEACRDAFDRGLVAVDECESVAAEFIQKTIKQEDVALNALRQTIDRAGTTLMLDAHAGADTLALLEALNVDPRDVLLITVDKPELARYQVNQFEETDNKNQPLKNALFAQIVEDLKAGKKVIVTSNSRETLNQLNKLVAEDLPDIKKIKVTSDTSSSAEARALNADTYGDYQLVMLSPSMSTGISFDKNHADTCYVFATNSDGTGTPYDCLQSMLRDRAVKSKTINLYYQCSEQLLSEVVRIQCQHKLARDACTDTLNDLLACYVDADTRKLMMSRLEQERPQIDIALQLTERVAVNHAHSKQHFLEILISELEAKGAAIRVCGEADLSYTLPDNTLADIRYELKTADIEAVCKAIKTTPAEAELLDEQFINRPDAREFIEKKNLQDPADRKATRIRNKIETELVTDLAEDPEPEGTVNAAINGGLMSHAREYDLITATDNEIRKAVKAAFMGIDPYSHAFMERLDSKKHSWRYRRTVGTALLSGVGFSVDNSGQWTFQPGIELSESAIRKKSHPLYPLLSLMQIKHETFLKSGYIPAETKPYVLKKSKKANGDYYKKIPLIEKILKWYGLKLSKRGSVYTVEPDSANQMVAILNRRAETGIHMVKDYLQMVADYKPGNHAVTASAFEVIQPFSYDEKPADNPWNDFVEDAPPVADAPPVETITIHSVSAGARLLQSVCERIQIKNVDAVFNALNAELDLLPEWTPAVLERYVRRVDASAHMVT